MGYISKVGLYRYSPELGKMKLKNLGSSGFSRGECQKAFLATTFIKGYNVSKALPTY